MVIQRLRGWVREDKRGDGAHMGRQARVEMPSRRADGGIAEAQ